MLNRRSFITSLLAAIGIEKVASLTRRPASALSPSSGLHILKYPEWRIETKPTDYYDYYMGMHRANYPGPLIGKEHHV